MWKATLAFVLPLIFSYAQANPIMCSAARVEISFNKSPQFPDNIETLLTASVGKRSTILRHDGNIDFIGAECRRAEQGKLLIVFQAYCGGSGCKDLDNYGIIDPDDLRVLLVPNDWNRSLASKIFGSTVTPIKSPLSVDTAYKKLFQR